MAQRDRLLGRIDALVATNEETAEAAAIRFPGEYRVVSEGIDPALFRPGAKRNLIVLEWETERARALLRGVFRALKNWPDWRLVLLRTKPLAGRPTIPRLLRDRVQVRTARDGSARAPLLAETSIFVPALAGLAARAARSIGGGAARSPSRRARASSPSWPAPKSHGSPRPRASASARRNVHAPTQTAKASRTWHASSTSSIAR